MLGIIWLPASYIGFQWSLQSGPTVLYTVAQLYYDGIADGDKLDKFIKLHKRDTVSTFGTCSSQAEYLSPRKSNS